MSLNEYFFSYKEEIELSQAQNRVECDLYSLIAYIIRDSKQASNISLRDVSVRRTSDLSKRFRSKVGFPDFIIMKREKSRDAAILGAIEAKYITENLDSEKHMKQLGAHIKSYNKVIYTNGIIWRFYNSKESISKPVWEVSLGEVKNKDEIIWHEDKRWNELINEIDNVNWEEEIVNR